MGVMYSGCSLNASYQVSCQFFKDSSKPQKGQNKRSCSQ
jgi:hypothetical protein